MRCLLAVLVLTLFAGCLRAPTVPPTGFITSINAPLSTNYSGNTPVGLKEGKATTTCILGLAAFGDASVHSAAKDGNIKTINFVDYGYVNILGIYQSFTVFTYGE